MKRRRDLAWLRDWRVRTLAAASSAVGFLIAALIFGKPWHLQPNWGDIPTWLAVAVATVGGWIALSQLRTQQQQIAEEAQRNTRRDELLDKQVAEAETRAVSERRRQAEDVEALRRTSENGSLGYVYNGSRRPISAITCRIMSKADRRIVASPARSGPAEPGPGGEGWLLRADTKPVQSLESLRPGARGGFSFPELHDDLDQVLVAWFTDDAGFRWQLDENQHLVSINNGNEYLP